MSRERVEKNENDLWYNINRTNLQIIGIPEREEKGERKLTSGKKWLRISQNRGKICTYNKDIKTTDHKTKYT